MIYFSSSSINDCNLCHQVKVRVSIFSGISPGKDYYNEKQLIKFTIKWKLDGSINWRWLVAVTAKKEKNRKMISSKTQVISSSSSSSYLNKNKGVIIIVI